MMPLLSLLSNTFYSENFFCGFSRLEIAAGRCNPSTLSEGMIRVPRRGLMSWTFCITGLIFLSLIGVLKSDDAWYSSISFSMSSKRIFLILRLFLCSRLSSVVVSGSQSCSLNFFIWMSMLRPLFDLIVVFVADSVSSMRGGVGYFYSGDCLLGLLSSLSRFSTCCETLLIRSFELDLKKACFALASSSILSLS